MSPVTIILVSIILAISALIYSALGFGYALIAMPLITLITQDVTLATPLVALCAVTLSWVMSGSDARHIEVASAWRLIVASVIGMPVGLAILLLAPSRLVTTFLGIFLIAFSLYNLTRPHLPQIQRRGWVYLFGFVAGILGGAYNTGGPPLVLYGTLRRWSPARFRATLQGYFAVTGIVVLVMHWLSGLWTAPMWQLFWWTIVLQIAAVWLGQKINRRIPLGAFTRSLYAILLLLGLLLLI